MEQLDNSSLDLTKMNIEKVKELFPSIVTEGTIDFEMLKILLGGGGDVSREKYQFTWPGKRMSIKIAQTPSTAVLRPCKAESKNWDTTENLYIEGDNLEVLKQLQKTYYGKIKMIYIDPPYNTGNDFVYHDNFKNSLENYKEQTQQNSSNPESNGRFHSDWLNMMYPRLMLAKNLLSDDGVIFISIDDNEQKNLNNICDEIFGEKNRVAIFPWRKRTAKSDVPFGVSQDYEWIICYSKGSLFSGKIKGKGRNYYETPDFPGRPWRIHDMTKQTTASERPNSFFTMINPKNGDEFPCDPNRTWRITKDTFKKYYDENEIVFPGDYKFLKITKPQARYFKDKDQEKDGDSFGKVALSTKLPEDIGMSQNGTKDIKNIFGAIPFSFPKPVSLIKYILAASTFNNSIVLDFFSGSSTTAHAVMKLNSEDGGNRKFIMVQLPETCDEKSEAYKAGYKTICDIGKERIRRAGDKIVSEMESTEGDLFTESKPELDIGFKVFQLDSTNIKPWDSEIQIDEDELTNFSDVFKEDRTKEDILYEIMLKYGVFDEPVAEEVVNGKTMYRVGKRHMLVCLEDNITALDVKAIGELKPKVVIFKDSGFRNDNDKINAVYNLKNAGIEDVKSI